MTALAIMALVGFGSQANAQAQCPELIRLRGEAAVALEQTTTVPAPNRCNAYNRFSMARAKIARYARDHRELCDISGASLSEFEKRSQEALKASEDVCYSSRRLRPFPAEIRPR
jgi:hypothetical protein